MQLLCLWSVWFLQNKLSVYYRFAVIGSTGRHYNVELADDRHTCQCPDFRVRHRACKHIKLVLQQLGISEDSKDWHKVLAQCCCLKMLHSCLRALPPFCTPPPIPLSYAPPPRRPLWLSSWADCIVAAGVDCTAYVTIISSQMFQVLGIQIQTACWS